MIVSRHMNLKQFVQKGVKFGFVGALGTILNISILYGLTNFAHLFYIYSELVAIVLVFGFNYIGNILVGNIKIDRATRDRVEPAR